MTIVSNPLSRFLFPLTVGLLGTALSSQCQLDWQPGTALSGPSGRVIALENMPNGDLVVGGWFLEAGGVIANRLARYAGSTWSAFGSGLDHNVYDIVVAPNGLGLNGIVNCLKSRPNGDLLTNGHIIMAGSDSAGGRARWDGAIWSAIGAGATSAIERVGLTRDGEVFVAGAFMRLGGMPSDARSRAARPRWIATAAVARCSSVATFSIWSCQAMAWRNRASRFRSRRRWSARSSTGRSWPSRWIQASTC
ncbi:MAG: hypothetical protein ACI89X_004526 [Planctomycetota bacterium]|jgi:hypothetical protein